MKKLISQLSVKFFDILDFTKRKMILIIDRETDEFLRRL